MNGEKSNIRTFTRIGAVSKPYGLGCWHFHRKVSRLAGGEETKCGYKNNSRKRIFTPGAGWKPTWYIGRSSWKRQGIINSLAKSIRAFSHSIPFSSFRSLSLVNSHRRWQYSLIPFPKVTVEVGNERREMYNIQHIVSSLCLLLRTIHCFRFVNKTRSRYIVLHIHPKEPANISSL